MQRNDRSFVPGPFFWYPPTCCDFSGRAINGPNILPRAAERDFLVRREDCRDHAGIAENSHCLIVSG